MEKLIQLTNIFYSLCLKLSLFEGWYYPLKRAALEMFSAMVATEFLWIFPLFMRQVFALVLLSGLLYILREGNSVKECKCSKEWHVMLGTVNKSIDNTRKWKIEVESLSAWFDAMTEHFRVRWTLQSQNNWIFLCEDCLIYILHLKNKHFHLLKNRPTFGLRMLLIGHDKTVIKKKVIVRTETVFLDVDKL